MTNRAVSVAGLQTLGAGLSLDVAREADELGYAVGVGRRGERGRGDVAARRDQPGRAARRHRHRRARAAAAHAAAARDGRRDAAAARRRPRRVPRRRHLVARGRRPVARRGLHRPADRAGARVRHPAARVPRAARPSPSKATSTRSSASGSACGSASAARRSSLAALNEQMLRLGGRARRRRAAQLPARVARAVVRRAGARGGDAEIYAYVHCGSPTATATPISPAG